LDEVGFFEKKLKFWKVVYPLRMSPFGLKICGHVFQTILQKYFPQEFFGWGGIFRSVEGTDAVPRAHGPGALWSQPVSADGNKKNQIASRFDFCCLYYFLKNLVRRYLTFVATALSKKISYFGRSFTPRECLRLAWKFVDVFFRRYCKNTFPRFFLDEVGFFETNLKFRKVVYPPRMSPFGLKFVEMFFRQYCKNTFPRSFLDEVGFFEAQRAWMQCRGHMGRAH
jgi:hypothetical protein